MTQLRWSAVGGWLGAIAVLPGLAQPAPDPNAAADYRLQGLAYRQQGRLDEAIATFQQAVERDPSNIDGRVLLGWTQHLHQQRPEAIATLRTTVYQSPLSVEPWNALGIVYLVENNLDDAVMTHHWAALLQPDNEIAYFNLSLAYQRLERHDWAIVNAQQAADLEPTNPHPLIALALAQWSAGDRRAAQSSFAAALSLEPGYGDWDSLQYLSEAAFSPDQIALSRTILDSLGS
jgi:tetratricopeptide (TPR) repeat protein